MLIFWHQGGLHLEPEGEQERKALAILVENVKFAKPKRPVAGSSSADGADKLLKTLTQGGSSHSKKPDTKRSETWWGSRPEPTERER